MKTKKKLLLSMLLMLLAATSAIWLNRMFFMPKTIAEGCFHQVAHKGQGCALLIEKPNGQFFLQLVDFKTTENNDLQILLISATDALENETVKSSERFFVAPLQKSEGFQEYLVPDGHDLTKFNSVVIWNSKYSVNFTTAPLRRF